MRILLLKNIFILIISVFISGSATAQSKLAQLKFQDAEELYAKDDFAGALLKLEDAEKLTGKTNPPMLFLRIQSLNGLFLADPYANYKTLEGLRKHTATFLKEFDNVKGIEDKYRDVYKIGESLSAYPKDYESFAAAKTSSKIKKEDNLLKQRVEDTKLNNAFDDFIYFDEYQLGNSLEEASSIYRDFYKHSGNKKLPEYLGVKGKWIYTKNSDFYAGGNTRVLYGFLVYNNIVCGYAGSIKSTYENAPFSQTMLMANDLVNDWNKKFGFNADKKDIDPGFKNTIAQTYTWRRNGKIIMLTCSQTTGKTPIGMIYMESFDEKLGNKPS